MLCYSSSLLPEETDHAYCLVVSDEVSESSVSESVSSLDDAFEYSGEDGDFTQLDSCKVWVHCRKGVAWRF